MRKILLLCVTLITTLSVQSQVKRFATSTPVSSSSNVTGAALAADEDLSTKARLTSSLTSNSRFIELIFPATVPANTPVYVKVDMEDNQFPALIGGGLGNLLSDLLGGILGGQNFRVQAKSGTSTIILDSNNTAYSGYTDNRLRVVRDKAGVYYLMVIPNADFDRVRITNTVPALSTSKWFDVYGAFYLTGTSECALGNYTSFSGGGIATVASNGVFNAHYAIDNDYTNFSSLNLGLLGVAAHAEQSVYFEGSSDADDKYTVKLKLSPALLNVGVINNVKLIAHNKGSFVASVNLGALLNTDLIGLLNQNTPVSIPFYPGAAADRITIRLEGLASVSLAQTLDLYGVVKGDFAVNITGGGTYQVNQAVTLTAQTTGCTGPYTYSWQGLNSTAATATPSTATPGTFNYKVTVTDAYGMQQIATTQVIVEQPPVAGTAAASRTICPATSTQLTLTGYTGTIQWQQSANGTSGWTNVTAGTGATTATYTTPALTTTTYYRAVVTSGSYTPLNSNVVTVTINDTNTWTGAISTAWNTPGNWECGVVPTLLTNAAIPVVVSGNYPVINNADGLANCKNITVAGGARITVNGAGAGTLRIAGTINNAGTINAVDGTIAMLGTSAQVIPANTFQTNTLRNLTVNNAAGVTLGGATNLTGILRLTAGQFITGNVLTLKSNAATTAMVAEVTGSITGTMIVERYLPARRAFRFMSSPVNGGSINANWQEGRAEIAGLGTDITGADPAANGFDPSSSNNPSLFTFNNISRAWTAVASTLTTNLQAGAAYRLMVRGDRTIDQFDNDSAPTNTTLRSTGNIATGNVVVSNFSDVAGNLNIVGNPYQAPVNMLEVLSNANNVNSTFYTVWDPTLGGAPSVGSSGGRGAYVTVDLLEGGNSNAASIANQYLQPNQACFVQTLNNGAASLTFREANKTLLTNSTPSIYRTNNGGSSASIKLQMFDTNSMALNGTSADGLVIRFSNEYADDVDAMDAIKLTNQDENVALLNGNKKLSIERRSLPDATDVISLFNSQYRKSNYTYTIQVANLDNGVTAYLVDKYTSTVTELVDNSETVYNFTVNENDTASINTNRFDIIFETNALNTKSFEAGSEVKLYPSPSTGTAFNIQIPAAHDAKVEIYNALGQKVAYSTAAQSDTILEIKPATPMAAGVYMVQVVSQGHTVSKKLIVNN